jgi:glutamate:Na+ symporter, ESS family
MIPSMTPMDLLWAFVFIGLALLAGKGLRRLFPVLADLFLPSSILGGFLVLLLGPQGLGALAARWLPEGWGAIQGAIPAPVLGVFRGLPGLLINVVFAALLLGKPIPGLRTIWRRAGSQAAYGQVVAWGQYVVGIVLCLTVLTPVFGLPPMAGALIEIAFEGGHGTAAGMAGVFAEMGFAEGADLALALATVGLVSGVVAGTILVNWAGRRGLLQGTAGGGRRRIRAHDAGMDEDVAEELRDVMWEREQELKPTDPLSIHLAVVGLAIGLGWLMREGLVRLEAATWARNGGIEILRFIPLFPMAMLGGVAIQIVLDRTGLNRHVSRRLMNRISGASLDFTIVAALGSLSLSAVRTHWASFLLLSVAGLAWNLFALRALAPRLMPDHWFHRGICNFGQSTGVTVTGLLLLRMADPANESDALEGFGYKQLLFEPIVGGGLFTAASVPLLARLGPWIMLAITGGLLAFWLAAGWMLFGRPRQIPGNA